LSGYIHGGGGEVPIVATIGTIESASGIPYVGTIGTILSANISVSANVSTITYVATIGTILSANITVSAQVSTLNFLGTIGTMISGQVSATIESGLLQYVATIGTILGAAAAGTVQFGTVSIERYWSIATLQQNASIVGGFTGTFDMSVWSQISLNIIAGTVTAGSLQVALMGVDPVSQLVVSSIVTSDWLSSGYRQRITADVIAGETLAASATVIGTAVGLTCSVERKS